MFPQRKPPSVLVSILYHENVLPEDTWCWFEGSGEGQKSTESLFALILFQGLGSDCLFTLNLVDNLERNTFLGKRTHRCEAS